MKRILLSLLIVTSAFGQTPKTKINNGQLTTDFDLAQHQLLNWSPSQTFPPINPPAASIVDSMVAANAAISQTKLNFNGLIPPGWLGSSSTTAAAGNDSRLSNARTANALLTATTIPLKTTDPSDGQVLGYVAADGKWEPVSVAGTGTVTSVGPPSISLAPLGSIAVTNQTSTPTFTYSQSNSAANSWFGNGTGSSAAPAFNTSPLPAGLIPNLDGSKITTGTVATARLAASIQRLVASSVQLSGSTPAIDWSSTTVFYWTITGNSTPTFSNSTDPWSIVVMVTNTGAFTVTWPGTVHWIASTQPTQTSGSHTDAWGFWNVNGTVYGAVLQNY